MPEERVDGLSNAMAPTAGEAIDPVAMARRDLQKSLPKRFYAEAKAVAQDGAFVVLLDGRVTRTPARNKLALPSLAAAEAIAAEWARQEAVIDPAVMPLTRLSNSAIDGVVGALEATAEEIVKYAESDLVCYRAGEPDALTQAQAEAWDPVLAFARDQLGARFICAEGVIFVAQPESARRAVQDAVAGVVNSGAAAPFALAALNVMTTLTGSALLALAVAHGELTPARAWAAAHVDEDFQMQIWGADEEAMRRRARRWDEMEAAAKLWEFVRQSFGQAVDERPL
ncbi:ATP12 family chaperone protein [Methylocapsa acidiphila]|uniref:ATP12 family chaperone protein n=1 Tax=Methylocapsa acidiphila TaxID=133552 RepID=UPI000688B290|nr:ATP12 family protein [Methylocapsa acidiphila]